VLVLVVSTTGGLCRAAAQPPLKSAMRPRITLNPTPSADSFALKRAVARSWRTFVAATEVVVNSPG
jgi:hypothetical protein